MASFDYLLMKGMYILELFDSTDDSFPTTAHPIKEKKFFYYSEKGGEIDY